MAGGYFMTSGKKTRRHVRMMPLILDTWNVHTLMVHGDDRPEWQTAVITRELARHKVLIAAVSGT